MGLEVGLIGLEHPCWKIIVREGWGGEREERTIEPGEELVGAVVGVHDHGAEGLLRERLGQLTTSLKFRELDLRGSRKEIPGAFGERVVHSHSVGGGDRTDVVGGSDGTSDGSLLLVVLEALATEEGGSTLGDLEDDGGLGVAGTLKGGNDGRGRRNVLSIKISADSPIDTTRRG